MLLHAIYLAVGIVIENDLIWLMSYLLGSIVAGNINYSHFLYLLT
jgi:hypothetical protein